VLQGKVQQVVDELGVLANRVDLPASNPLGIEPSHSGYMMLNIERTTEIMALHEAILELVASARQGLSADKYGSEYIRDSFVSHVSLAKLDRHDVTSATAIGRQALGSCHPARTRTLDLCDIGPRSERWDVLASFPIGRTPKP
jgi:hypothetical protein